MKIKFHHILALFVITLFFDLDFELSFVRLRILDFCLVGVGVLMILSAGRMKTMHNGAALSLYVLIIYILVNGLFKVSAASIVKEIIQLIEYIFLMHLIAEATREPEKRKEFINILFWGTGIIAFSSMMYNVAGGKYANYKNLDAPKHSFAFFALLAVIRLFSSQKKSVFQFGIVLVALMMLLLSGERKGWAGFLAGSAVFTFLQIRSSNSLKNIRTITTFFVLVGVVGLLTVLVLIAMPQFHYLDRQLTSLSDVSNMFSGKSNDYASGSDEERVFMLNFGIRLFQKYPVSGIGIDEFHTYIAQETHGLIKHDAHNFYLKMLVENGAIGLSLFLLPLLLIFVELWKLAKNRIPHISRDSRIAIALFFLGSVVNLFLAGKALSWLYVILPCGLILGINRELLFHKPIKDLRQ